MCDNSLYNALGVAKEATRDSIVSVSVYLGLCCLGNSPVSFLLDTFKKSQSLSLDSSKTRRERGKNSRSFRYLSRNSLFCFLVPCQFKEAHKAYMILSDPLTRLMYDRFGEDGLVDPANVNLDYIVYSKVLTSSFPDLRFSTFRDDPLNTRYDLRYLLK